jgi:hypothetical protein
MSGHPTCPSCPFQFTKGKSTDIERASGGGYLGGYKPIKDIHLSPPQPPLKLPSRTGNFNLEPELYNLLNATHHLLNLTNPPLVVIVGSACPQAPSIR